MTWQIEQRNGLFLPDIDWFLDARKPVERSFVSHAHFDHMGDHQSILCSPVTAQLIQKRIPGKRDWRIHDFGEPFDLAPNVKACLYPAGHIPGSSMLWLEKEGHSLLYSGDFKLTPGIAAEPCQPVLADTLVVESTYGIPRYTFPPEKEVFADIIRFCRDTLDNGETPILFGYSLGKSQAILRSLAEAELEIMLHPSAHKLTLSCQSLGWDFPPYHLFEARNHRGKVLISPPMQKNAEWLKSIHKPKTAIISGWAIDSSATYRYQCDKAFPLSDHADYLDLLSFVNRVQPKQTYTIHGFATEFAQTLRAQGYQALALGRENQLDLELPSASPPDNPLASKPESNLEPTPNSLAALAQTSEKIANTDNERQKIATLGAHLAKLNDQEAGHCIRLLDSLSPTLSADLKAKDIKQALLLATNTSASELARLTKTAPSSSATQLLVAKLTTRTPKLLGKTCSFLKTLASAPNPTFKQSLLYEEFKNLCPIEAQFLFQYLSQTENNGLTPNALIQAISERFEKPFENVQAAFLRNSDLSAVSKAASQNSLDQVKIEFFKPVPAVEATEVRSPEAVIEQQGFSLWSEPEYDGLRCQLHKQAEHAELYSKTGNRISHLFPEILEAARLIPQQFIADAVIVPWNNESPLPKNELKRRLNRKGEELFLGEEVQVVLWLIDLLCLDNDDLLDQPIEERRHNLDTFTVNTTIRIAPVTSLLGVEEIENALESTAKTGSRGIVFKASNSPYNPLSQSPAWLRLPASIQS